MKMTDLKIIKKVFAKDKSIKYILGLSDEECIEAVYIPLIGETKFCISCQVGCINKCSPCATGKDMDYIRDLCYEEIFLQVKTLAFDNNICYNNCTVLFMGMGEPFFNYSNVIKSLQLFQDIGIPPENITISTSGIIPCIVELSKLERRPKLAISLHATTNEQRNRVIPINKVYPLNDLLNAAKEYTDTSGDEIIIQYTLIERFNNTVDDLNRLVKCIENIKCELQIIPFNSFPSSNLIAPSKENVEFVISYLQSKGVKIALKQSSGNDVYAGCGQLGCKQEL